MAHKITNIFVAGATSQIAQETLREFAERGSCHFLLAARNQEKLDAFAEDLRARGDNQVSTIIGDLVDSNFHLQLIQTLEQKWDKTDVAILAWGLLGEEETAQQNFQEAKRVLVVNGTSYISLLTELGKQFAAQNSGTIAVITSVAGDRGRRKNYVYGSSKALVSNYLSGFRGRMADYGVKVVEVRPGSVSTPMTAHAPKGLLMADASAVGRSIYRVIKRRQSVAYVPWFWRWIMLVVKCVPVMLFKRLKF